MDSGLRRNDGARAVAGMAATGMAPRQRTPPTPRAARSAEKEKAPIGRFINKPGEEILSLRWAGHRESNSYFLFHVLRSYCCLTCCCSYRYFSVACPEPMTPVRVAVALSLASTG